jgi:hypothetical protein
MNLTAPFVSAARSVARYLAGRGVISTGVLAGTLAFGGGAAAVLIAAGSVLFAIYQRRGEQANYEHEMLEMYREDIADQLGIAPEQVNLQHMKKLGQSNPVIADALARQNQRSWLSFGTAVASGLVTFGLLSVGLDSSIQTAFNSWLGAGTTAANILGFASTSIVAGISSLVFHDGLEWAIGHKTGLSGASVHDYVAKLERQVARGKAVTPSQVFDVFVAANTQVQENVSSAFGERYFSMNAGEKMMVMQELGVLDAMQQLAQDVNAKKLAPAQLAFMLETHTALPPRSPQPAPVRAQAISSEPSPARPSHVARLGREARTQGSFRDQILAEKADIAAAQKGM